jgi:hypothetical protein
MVTDISPGWLVEELMGCCFPGYHVLRVASADYMGVSLPQLGENISLPGVPILDNPGVPPRPGQFINRTNKPKNI